ncbi:MAG: signal recognition particle protein [Alphaproteobacteria bacterium]|nr:signal recognition particle protein [Alphaproteobacteria bacterium]
MFDSLSERLGGIFTRLRGRGVLDAPRVDAALAEVRDALLEADVALPVVSAFIEAVRLRAVGVEVLKSVTPGQQVVKIVHDVLVDMLGAPAPLSLGATPPIAIMMVGLQGSGKTTTTAKLAHYLTRQEKRKVLMASLDTHRPAAMEQLAILGARHDIATLAIVKDTSLSHSPTQIASRACEAARLGGYDIVLLDTAGRTHADEALMAEMAAIEAVAHPHETLLVADSLTGQEAARIASSFAARVSLTGLVLTRADGDGRGGAALSMRHQAEVPIKFLGTGEAVEALEVFDATRIANRILGMGDIVGLVEKAAAVIDEDEATRQAARMRRGQFSLQDLADQLRQMQNMGGLSAIMDMLPTLLPTLLGGRNKASKQMTQMAGMEGKALLQQLAIVSSMTLQERENPKLLNANRKKRIATGSGTNVQAVNKIIKMHRQMADMMKKLGRGGLGNMEALMGGKTTPNMGAPNMGASNMGDMAIGDMTMPNLSPNLLPKDFLKDLTKK